MKRHNRLHFALLGLPAIINMLLLLIVTFHVTFRMNIGFKWLLPLFAALGCLVLALYFAAKRGRDIGWPAMGTIGIVLVSVVMLPAVLISVGVLLFLPARPGGDRFGPAPDGVSPLSVVLAFVLAALPWLLMVATRMI